MELLVTGAKVSVGDQRPFFYHRLTLIPAWISNNIASKVWDEIAYPSPNVDGAAVEIWKSIVDFIPHFSNIGNRLPILGWKLTHISKRCPTCSRLYGWSNEHPRQTSYTFKVETGKNTAKSGTSESIRDTKTRHTVKPVYNDHPMGYFSAFWSSSRWPLAT